MQTTIFVLQFVINKPVGEGRQTGPISTVGSCWYWAVADFYKREKVHFFEEPDRELNYISLDRIV